MSDIPFIAYGVATLVPSNSETTVSTYTVTATCAYLTGIYATGDIEGLYTVYINGNAILAGRTTAADPNFFVNFGVSTPIAADGQTIKITITHYHAGLQGNYNGSIMGYM